MGVCARVGVWVCVCVERAGVGSSASKARDIRATEQRCAGSSSSSSRSQSRVSEGRRAYLFFCWSQPHWMDGCAITSRNSWSSHHRARVGRAILPSLRWLRRRRRRRLTPPPPPLLSLLLSSIFLCCAPIFPHTHIHTNIHHRYIRYT